MFRRTALLFWPLVTVAVIAALPAAGQTPATEALERRILELEEKLKRMEQTLQELQARRDGPHDPPPVNGPAADGDESAAAPGPTLEALDQGIRVLHRQREIDREEAAAKAQDSAVAVAGRDGFWIRSANGDFKLNLAGYVQSDGRFYLDNTNKQGTNTFLLRRVRPILQGTLYKNIDFRLTPDFGGGLSAIQDAYLDFRYSPKASIRAGKFKAPVGLEQLQADQDITFQERALPANLVPNRDLGIQLSGDVAANRLNYAIGVFDGTPDGASVDGDTNNGKDVAARLFATPFQNRSIDHPLKGLGFGLGASTGKQDGTLPSFKTPGQVTFFSYGSTVLAAGARTRLSPQAYYYYGPLGVLFEHVRSEQRVKKGTATPVVTNNGWQLAGSYFLTGERKSYKGVSVPREFDPFRGGWGAWELVARFEQLSLDREIFSLGLADSSKSARQARAWAAGVNWYLNRNIKLVLNYEDTAFLGGSASGDRSREHALLSRFQIGF